MTEWKRFKRLMALYMCRAERYTLAVWTGGDYIFMCIPDGIDMTVPTQDSSLFASQGSRIAREYTIEYVTPQELETRIADQPIKVARLDAVTKPSLPEEHMPKLLDCFLPKVGDRRTITFQVRFPDDIFTEFATTWHDALKQAGMPRDSRLWINEPRYNPAGETYETRFGRSDTMARADGYSYFMSRLFPGTSVTTNHNYLQTTEALKAFPVDSVWMTRALLELIPVHLYQSVIFGEHSMVLRGIGHLWSSMIYAPVADTSIAADKILELHTKYMPEAIKYDGPCGIANYISRDNSSYSLERGLWKQRTAGMFISSLENGLRSCAPAMIGIRLNEPIVEYSSQLDGLKMPYAASSIYQLLLDQHNNDALSSFIGNPWEDD